LHIKDGFEFQNMVHRSHGYILIILIKFKNAEDDIQFFFRNKKWGLKLCA